MACYSSLLLFALIVMSVSASAYRPVPSRKLKVDGSAPVVKYDSTPAGSLGAIGLLPLIPGADGSFHLGLGPINIGGSIGFGGFTPGYAVSYSQPQPYVVVSPYTSPVTGYGEPAPVSGYGYPAPVSGYGEPAPVSGYGYPTPVLGYGYPTPVPGYGHPAPVPYYGEASPVPVHGEASPVPVHGEPAPVPAGY